KSEQRCPVGDKDGQLRRGAHQGRRVRRGTPAVPIRAPPLTRRKRAGNVGPGSRRLAWGRRGPSSFGGHGLCPTAGGQQGALAANQACGPEPPTMNLDSPSQAEAEAAELPPAATSFPVAGVGASAGGLEAVTTLLRGLPADA